MTTHGAQAYEHASKIEKNKHNEMVEIHQCPDFFCYKALLWVDESTLNVYPPSLLGRSLVEEGAKSVNQVLQTQVLLQALHPARQG